MTLRQAQGTPGAIATASRYRIEERLESTPRGERALAQDERLRRRVLVWTAAGEPTDPRREALLGLARQGARLTHPAFLPVLDAGVEAERATVVLQAPSCGALTQDAMPSLDNVGGAPRLLLEVARALEDAENAGLGARWLPLSYLYCCPEGIRLDPIGVLALPGEDARDAVALLLGLASELNDPSRALREPQDGASGNEGDADLASLVQRWRKRSTARRSLPRLIAELEAIAPDATLYPLVQGADDADATLPLPALAVFEEAPPAVQPRSGPAAGVLVAVIAVVAGAVLLGMALGSAAGLWQGAERAAAPTPVPSNVATMRLTAQRDAPIRVLVDQQLKADGVLRQGQSQFFEGTREVWVVTNGARDLLLEINGYQLGTVAQAVGHPEWNAVDWAWRAGWKPQGR